MQLNDDIHNYYEKLVINYINLNNLDKRYSSDFLSDLCCIVLNQLPSKYIRHEVDMAFYMPAAERYEMEMNVRESVKRALEFMDSREQRED